MARPKQPDMSRLYHLNSSNTRRILPDLSVDTDRRPQRFRTYAGSQRIGLTGRNLAMDIPLGLALEQRRSMRDFELKTLPLEKLGRLLHAGYGVCGERKVEGEWSYMRPVPSAGGLYPLELYVAAQMVDGAPDGIYHYDARAHELELRRLGIFHAQLADMTIGQEMLRDANLVIMIAAVVQRTMWKYGQRGYRYVWLDAGHVGQNIYLAAAALGLGPVGIGGFFDAEVNELIGLPAGEEEVIYIICAGQPRS